MLELTPSPHQLPLQLASRVLSAPGVWAPGSRLPLDGLGALVTPPLGWEWDGGPAAWEARPGALLWAPPRRPLDRFLRRLAREGHALPRLFTLAPDAPQQIEAALRPLESEEVAGILLWEATPEAVAAGRRGAPAVPLLAEVPCGEKARAADLLAAGADGLWLGAPRVGRARLWGPALLPMALAALEATAPLGGLRVAGVGVASATDAQRLRAAGADAVALGPEWWVQPGLLAALAALLP